MTYQPIPAQEAGGQRRLWSADDEVRELLKELLVEMKIVNLHLSVMTDNAFTEKDTEKQE
jgi:hypothetical protein